MRKEHFESKLQVASQRCSKAEAKVAHLRSEVLKHRQSEADLRKRASLYRNIIETTNAIVWELETATFQFTYISPQIEKLSGYTAQEWKDFEFWASLIHPEDRDDAVQWCELQTSKGVDHVIEYRMRTKDGRLVWIRDGISVIKEQGKADMLRGYFIDITDQKNAEEEIQMLETRMHRTQKLESLGIMASGIAHDFNNHLAGMIGNTELALTETVPGSSLHQLLSDIQKSGNHAAELIREMLAFAGKEKVTLRAVDLNAELLDMWNLLEAACSKNVVLIHDLQKNLPTVEADGALLKQIALNLIMNASDAIGAGAGAGSITVKTSVSSCAQFGAEAIAIKSSPEQSAQVVLEVCDTGCGIEKDAAPKIFDPFFTTKDTGRGLGLAAVQGIIRGHNGTVSVVSSVDEGTTFKICLPIPLQPISTSPLHEVEDSKPKSNGLILLVEDEEMVRTMARKILEHCGFSVLVAADGIEALDVFRQRQHQIDCVLLDLRMPRMNGEETLVAMQAVKPDVKVVLASGDCDAGLAGRLNATEFVRKPYSIATINAALTNAIGTPVQT